MISLIRNSPTTCRISLQLQVKVAGYKPKFRLFTQTTSVLKQVELKEPISNKIINEPDNYKVIYRNPYIKFGTVINRVKWLQTIVSGVTISTCSVLYLSGVIPLSLAVVTSYMAAVFIGTLYLVGFFFTRGIGFIYLSRDEKTVKIAYLDFWGKRVDLERPVEDFMCFTDLPNQITDVFYKTVKLYSVPKSFKLIAHGQIVDTYKYIKVFGDLQ